MSQTHPREHRAAPKHCKARAGVHREHAWGAKAGQCLSWGSTKASKPQGKPMSLLSTWEQPSRCREAKRKKQKNPGQCQEMWISFCLSHRINLKCAQPFSHFCLECSNVPGDTAHHQTCADTISAPQCSLLPFTKSHTCCHCTSHFISFGATSSLVS